MDYFNFKDNILFCENVPIPKIAEKVGTPFYLYSYKTIIRHIKIFKQSLYGLNSLICYSVKANSNLAILKIFANEGLGFDIVSGGELFRVEKAGGDTKKIVFSGVGKEDWEIRYALLKDILLFNVESEQELLKIEEIAKFEGKVAPVSFRINPKVDPKTHPHLATGIEKSKFGISLSYAETLYMKAKNSKFLDPMGIDCHIGSQITEIQPFEEAFSSLLSFCSDLISKGVEIKFVDLGGGLGIRYRDENPPHPEVYGKKIKEIIEKFALLDTTLIFEPGRVIVGNSGVLVGKVLYVKRTHKKNFLIVDCGMNDFMRPTLYGAEHEIMPVEINKREKDIFDVVGPICESGDFLAKDRVLDVLCPGDLFVVRSAGAYGFCMSSNYNSRRRPAEVIVKDDKFYVVREREKLSDLIRGEKVFDELYS